MWQTAIQSMVCSNLLLLLLPTPSKGAFEGTETNQYCSRQIEPLAIAIAISITRTHLPSYPQASHKIQIKKCCINWCGKSKDHQTQRPSDLSYTGSIRLCKLQYFTNLKRDDSPIKKKNIIYGFRSRREVVMKFTQIHLMNN